MGKQHKKIPPNNSLLLFNEVDGICPLCQKMLMYEKSNRIHKGYDTAHIYPLNPKPEEKTLLKKEKRLSSDPDDPNNLILLCLECHEKFDKPRTAEEYRELFAIKAKLIKEAEHKEAWHSHNIESELIDILNILVTTHAAETSKGKLNYEPKTIDKKTDNSITELVKSRIKSNVSDYFQTIKEKLNNVEKEYPGKANQIALQIKLYYGKLAMDSKDQRELFHGMVDWLHNKSGKRSREASEVIISFFVQNCEVFS